jgi:hypothetical protein
MYNTTAAPMAKYSNHVQTGKEVNKVYQTSDLSIFKQIDGNRVPNLQHIKRLADSIRVYGMKCNPILVNERMEVIDGQHRLMAAKEAESFVYYIIINGYSLNEVHTLNLNQKNWNISDYLEGYANLGIESYIILRDFYKKNYDFNLSSCMSFCQNTSTAKARRIKSQLREGTKVTLSGSAQIFEQGTWKNNDINIAQDWANKIRMIYPYFDSYNSTSFVSAMITLFLNKNFNFNQFISKLELQPTELKQQKTIEQYITLIEKIYNYKSRNKISLKY